MLGERIERRRRLGSDRLFVTDPDGRVLGWHDLRTGQTLVRRPGQAAAVESAVQRWQRARELPLGAVGDPDDPSGAAQDDDLAANRPGERARARAHALRQQAPLRTLAARGLGLRSEERTWRTKADGQERVAGQLDRLVAQDERWRVLHTVPTGEARDGWWTSAIDHVAIGPGGVFALTDAAHPGSSMWVDGETIMVGGFAVPYLHNARCEAERASRLLGGVAGHPVLVTGVVVPVGVASLTVRHTPHDVRVVPRPDLARWLEARPQVMNEARITELYGVARRPAVWLGGRAN